MIRLRYRFAVVVLALAPLAGACALPHQMAAATVPPDGPACRTTATEAGATLPGSAAPSPASGVKWILPSDPEDRATLDAWCAGVGPALVVPRAMDTGARGSRSLVIVNWNANVGAGDLPGLVRDLRRGRFTDGDAVHDFVLLLQEAHRDSAAVPMTLDASTRTARRLQPSADPRERLDIVTIASELGLALYYAPSMRNGRPGETREDRGNAILSTLPLGDLTAIELPFERQRRVAIEATVQGTRADGSPWSLRVTNVHLENRAPARRLWLFQTWSRLRQTRGLLLAMSNGPAAVLGGDLNSWGGFTDDAYRELAERLPIEATDRRATFAGLARLDHLLSRLPTGWSITTRRLDRYGSDHHPLLARITVR